MAAQKRKPGRPVGSSAGSCVVCSSPHVAAVHLAAAKGVNTHVLAKRYGFVYQTLRRHLKLHLSESTRRMLAGDVYTDIDALLKRVSTGDAESIDLLNATIAGLFNLFNEQAVTRVNEWSQLSGGATNVDFLKPFLMQYADPYQNPFSARLAVRFEF